MPAAAAAPAAAAGFSIIQGPDTCMVRPHPAVWRLVHGVMVCYLLFMVFLLFQTVDDARQFMQVGGPCFCKRHCQGLACLGGPTLEVPVCLSTPQGAGGVGRMCTTRRSQDAGAARMQAQPGCRRSQDAGAARMQAQPGWGHVQACSRLQLVTLKAEP
jgi:hypothetical protein